MAKKDKNVGAYSKNDVKLSRPRNVDSIGNVRPAARPMQREVSISGGSASRPVTKEPVKRYGP